MQKKTAQALNLKHKARRLVNPTGKALEMINPAFKKVIRDLDKLDKRVRKEAEDLNYFMGMAKSFIRRRDYLSAATYLVKFHEKIKLINHNLQTFDGDISKTQRKYLLKHFKAKDKGRLFDYDPDKKIDSIKLVDDGLISTAAGLKDWWRTPGRFSDLAHNLTDSKSKGMKALEKSFSIPFYRQLKEDTGKMLSEANDFYKDLLENFHAMGSAWATRNVGAYIEQIKAVESEYKPFHAKFVEYYRANIQPMKEEQERLDEEAKFEFEKNNPGKADNISQERDPFPDSQAPGPKSPEQERALEEAGFGPSTNNDGERAFSDVGRSLENAPNSSLVSPNASNPSSHSVDVEFSKPSDEIVAPGGRVRSPSSEPFAKSPSYQDVAPQTSRSPGVRERPTMPSMKAVVPPTSVMSPSVRVPAPSVSVPAPSRTLPSSAFNPPPGKGPKVGPIDILKIKNPPTQRGMGPSPDSVDQFFRDAHQAFLGRIEVLSSEEDVIREILSYSEEVEKHSEEDSLKLLAVAEGMIEKGAGVFDRFVDRFGKKKPEGTKPDDSPSTELIGNKGPDTLPSGGGNINGPPTAALNTTTTPVAIEKEEPDVLSDIRPPTGLVPVNHGIPEGKVEQRWFDIPFLAKIQPNEIKISPQTANHLLKKVIQYMHHNFFPVSKMPEFNEKMIVAIRKSLTRSKIVSNMACGDKQNGRDCHLEVFAYIRLNEIDPYFDKNILSFNATLRLSVFSGDVGVKSLNNPKIHISNTAG